MNQQWYSYLRTILILTRRCLKMKHLSRAEKEALILTDVRNALRFFPVDRIPSLTDVQEKILWLDDEYTKANISLPVRVDGEETTIFIPFDFSFDNGNGLRMTLILPNHPQKGLRRKFTMETDSMPIEKEEKTKQEPVVVTNGHEEQEQL